MTSSNFASALSKLPISKLLTAYLNTSSDMLPHSFTYPVLYYNLYYNLYPIIVMIKNFGWKSFRKFATAKQWLDDELLMKEKIKKLAQMIDKAKYPILFTGAGISTAIGIPDYRSGAQTVVATGPGIWNRDLEAHPPKQRIDQIVDEAVPSITHMAIKTLLNKEVFKFLISQNTDGLHLKSGISINKIAQLHGNRNLQKCVQCQRAYLRDFRTIQRSSKKQDKHSHETGRQCQNCGGNLIDSIIYFGQKLPVKDLTNAFKQASSCDLLICIGSSLTVMPSANVPILASKNGACLSIINIQQTAFDKVSALKINAFCDPVMSQLMKQLKIKIDPFVIEHYMVMQFKEETLKLEGKDSDGNNFTYIKSVKHNEKLYLPRGHQIQVPINKYDHELQINLYGSKTPFSINLHGHYKLFHGEQLSLKIWKKQHQSDWSLQQI